MKQKKTSIKIKKSKYNLYNKKKSKSRQTLTIVLTVVAACVLAVVGYGVGKPIVDYFQSQSNSSADAPSAPDSANSASSDLPSDLSSDPSGDLSGISSGDSSNTETPTDPIEDIKLYVLPVEATASSASLGSALAAAREAGYNTVAVTLKDENGYLYYKTDLDKVKKTLLVKGSLTAAQISDQISKAGMTPAAKICMLKDRVTPMFFGGFTFANSGGWLDDYPPPEGNGKRWLSPFLAETVDYLADLTSELSAAGFEHIICYNVRYPAFHPIDINTYLSHLPVGDKAKRLEALQNVVNSAKSAAEENDAKLWVEMNGADLIKSDKYATDAELAANKEALAGVGIIADYTVSGTEGVYDSAVTFAKALRTAVGESSLNNTAVMVKRGISGTASADIHRAFEENELNTFTES